MPAISFADNRARIGVFNNATHSGQDSIPSGRQLQGLLGVSNTPRDPAPSIYAPMGNGIYPPLSIPVSPDDMREPGSRAATGGMGSAMKRHPWATGIVLTTAVLATVAVVARPASDGSVSAAAWPDSVPQPQPLVVSGSDASVHPATIVGICNRAIDKFPRAGEAHENFPSMKELYSIRNDAESILQIARSMVRDNVVGSRELRSAADCSGVRLRRNKVEPLIADLQAEKSRLLEGVGGDSVDMPERVLVAQIQITGIDRRLGVLTQTSRHLYDATVALNTRLLQMAG